MKNRSFLKLGIMLATVCSSCKNLPNLGSGYKLAYSGRSNFTQIEYKNEIIVGDNISNYKFNDKFILVMQNPPDSIPEQKHYSDWKTIYEKRAFHQYWIIDKASKLHFETKAEKYLNVFGPLNKKQYLNKGKQLKIPISFLQSLF